MSTPVNKIFSFKEFGKAGNPVIFFFTAFGGRYWQYYPTIRTLTKAGYYVVIYDGNAHKIVQSEVTDFLKAVEDVVENVRKQTKRFKKIGIKSFFSFGVSMGTLLGLRATVEIPEIKKMVVNLTYGSFADNVWAWEEIRKRLEKTGVNKKKLESLLKPISPVSVAPKLKGKKVLLYLSKKDKVIPFSQSYQFKKALDKAGVDYIYHQNDTFGHFISGMLNNTHSKLYLAFFKG